MGSVYAKSLTRGHAPLVISHESVTDRSVFRSHFRLCVHRGEEGGRSYDFVVSKKSFACKKSSFCAIILDGLCHFAP